MWGWKERMNMKVKKSSAKAKTSLKRGSASAPAARLAAGEDAREAQKPPAPPKKKVFVVDDHPIIRERLADLIAQEGDLEVCGEAADAITALRAMQARPPDLA